MTEIKKGHWSSYTVSQTKLIFVVHLFGTISIDLELFITYQHRLSMAKMPTPKTFCFVLLTSNSF